MIGNTDEAQLSTGNVSFPAEVAARLRNSALSKGASAASFESRISAGTGTLRLPNETGIRKSQTSAAKRADRIVYVVTMVAPILLDEIIRKFVLNAR